MTVRPSNYLQNKLKLNRYKYRYTYNIQHANLAHLLHMKLIYLFIHNRYKYYRQYRCATRFELYYPYIYYLSYITIVPI